MGDRAKTRRAGAEPSKELGTVLGAYARPAGRATMAEWVVEVSVGAGHWASVATLREGASITIGREHFLASDRRAAISRQSLEITASDGVVRASVVGSNACFYTAGDANVPLAKGTASSFEPGMVLSMDRAGEDRVRVVPAAPAPAHTDVVDLSSSEDDVEELPRREVEDLTRDEPARDIQDLTGASASASNAGAPVEVIDIDLENANGQGVGVSGKPLLPGEAMARQQRARRSWTLHASRSTDDAPEEQHYRLAESAFCRGGGQASSITAIEYHFHPELEARWHAKKLEYDRRFGEGGHTILFAFHGTRPHNVAPILATGFKVSKLGSTSANLGLYGAGIYFSEQLATSFGYNSGNTGMFLCKLLVGKPYLASVQVGRGLEPGYTSHVADPSGSEVIMFDEAAMLPIYVVKSPTSGYAGTAHPGHAAAAMASKEPLRGLGGGGAHSGWAGGAAPAMLPGEGTEGYGMGYGAHAHFPGMGHVLGGGKGGGPGGRGGGKRRKHSAWLSKLLSGTEGAAKAKAPAGAAQQLDDTMDDTHAKDQELQEVLRRSVHER